HLGPSMKDARILLEWALERIAEVRQYTAGGRGEFVADRKTQAAVLRNLQTMAESTQRLPDVLKARNPEVDWRGIVGFRNVLVHSYMDLDLDLVLGVIETRLPELEAALRRMLEEQP
ncbi:MAG TPA: HepT-like ribonuclease domain-containing protein, partial [Deinococcales bacterium]|nr:HepT-like ribonuclease domain-containing protein [Deinococcales bacterium]